MPLYGSLEEGLAQAGAEVVVDLSDEPVVTARDRMRAREPRRSRPGCRTSAPTSASTRCAFAPFELPALAVIGSGKRVGKTAVAGHLARLLAETRDVVVVAMGRGGPPEPGRRRGAAGRRGAPRARARGLARCLRLPRGRGARPRDDGRLPALRRRARRRAVRLERRGGRTRRRRARPGDRDLRGQRRRAPAGRVARAHARRGRRAGSRARRRLPRRLPDPRSPTSSCSRAARSRCVSPEQVARLREAIADVRPGHPRRRHRLPPAPGRAGRGPARRALHDRAEEVHDALRETLERDHGADVTLVSGNLAGATRCAPTSSAPGDADAFLVEIKAAAIDVVAEEAARARGRDDLRRQRRRRRSRASRAWTTRSSAWSPAARAGTTGAPPRVRPSARHGRRRSRTRRA